MDELISDFAADTRDGYDRIRDHMVRWSVDPSDKNALDAVFRFVHTVRGNSSFIKVERFEKLCIPVEHVLSELRSGKRGASVQAVKGILAVVDRIGMVAVAIEEGGNISAADEAAMIDALEINGEIVEQPLPSQRQAPRGRTVRLSVAQFDALCDSIESLDCAHRALLSVVAHISAPSVLNPALLELSTAIASTTAALVATRQQRFSELVIGLERLTIQTAQRLGKRVQLDVQGDDLMIDRASMSVLRDVLVHIIRNAVDHGIELPETRAASGKDKTGTVTVRASRVVGGVSIDISDDGQGIDEGKVRALINAAAVQVSDQPLLQTLAQSGFSTARDGSISGQGVGLDVVVTRLAEIGGHAALDNQPGAGFAITLFLPDAASVAHAA